MERLAPAFSRWREGLIDRPGPSYAFVRSTAIVNSCGFSNFTTNSILHGSEPRMHRDVDVPWHPITRKIAVGQGFEQHKNNPPALIKIALGLPVTDRTWGKIRLSIERLSGLGLQSKCPNYRTPIVSLTAPDGEIKEVGLFELETLLSPTIFILPGRDAVIVPITRTFAADLLGTDLQYSLLEKPEAQFLFRRTYLACTRFRRHRVRCFNGTGGGSWRGGSLHESSSLKRCG